MEIVDDLSYFYHNVSEIIELVQESNLLQSPLSIKSRKEDTAFIGRDEFSFV